MKRSIRHPCYICQCVVGRRLEQKYKLENRPKVTKRITKPRENALASALAKTHQYVNSLESTRCERVYFLE